MAAAGAEVTSVDVAEEVIVAMRDRYPGRRFEVGPDSNANESNS
jgi:hypothetical protein